MRLIKREVFWKAARQGTLTYGSSFYNGLTGVGKICSRAVLSKSDLIDSFEYGFSKDNGCTWSPLQERKVYEHMPGGGAIRRHIMPGFVDPVNGRLLTLRVEAKMLNDDALKDGMTHRYLRYGVSLDGGRTDAFDAMIIQKDHTAERPMEGVTVGKNAVMLGDAGSETIRTAQGKILVPVQVCPVDADGNYFNPGGGYTYHEAAVLIGTWNDDRKGAAEAFDLGITWDLSQYICNDPEKSTRGAVEPTIAQFPDGRILMVLRGSNDVRPELPGYKWYTISNDEGRSWEPVRPWTYSDGTPFFSPSSMSQLLKHSDGSYYWLGNISPGNPKGNSPRYPLVIGKVDPESLLLEKGSVFIVDDRQSGEDEMTTLSNFHSHEDRKTNDILLHLSRWATRGQSDWTADALLYRISIP